MSQDYFTGYLFVLIFLAVGAVLVIGGVLVAKLVAPHGNKSGAKLLPYESGEEAVGQAHVQFPIRFYIFALLFVVFDVEAIFLLAWATRFAELGVVGLVEMAVFIGVLVAGLVYAWRKGVLKWT
ncbi:MAG: NADH-quinone oxidoreductase subunit A [Chloroflexota bacterium]